MQESFDCLVIGAGMSGLTASIRLAMFGKKVALIEKHSIAGGLNSYYRRGTRLLDVGLHALTNFSLPHEKHQPLNRLLRQLRIPYGDLKLQEQHRSRVVFPFGDFSFENRSSTFWDQLFLAFPEDQQGLQALCHEVRTFSELDLNHPAYQSARQKVSSYLHSQELMEVLFCPLLIYGSAWENDCDWVQFVVMFKAIFDQGFAMPQGGVRRFLELLQQRALQEGVQFFYRHQVKSLLTDADRKVTGVLMEDGKHFTAPMIFSSMGALETFARCDAWKNHPQQQQAEDFTPAAAHFSFCESIFFLKEKASHWGMKDTIVFANQKNRLSYQCPEDKINADSAVICCPDHYGRKEEESGDDQSDGEGVIRITFMANPHWWCAQDRKSSSYLEAKEEVKKEAVKMIKMLYPQFEESFITFSDVFTPHTLHRYTGHHLGSVYGSPTKYRDGKTPISKLYLTGTDQGFLGVIGASLSGITVANRYALGGEFL